MTEQGHCETCVYGLDTGIGAIYMICRKINEGLVCHGGTEKFPRKVWGCIYHEARPEPILHLCKTCRYWEMREALLWAWGRCDERSTEHEHLQTRENHKCDSWAEKHG